MVVRFRGVEVGRSKSAISFVVFFFISIALVLVTTSADSLASALHCREKKFNASLLSVFFSFINLFISQFELNENREIELQNHLDFSLLGFQFLANASLMKKFLCIIQFIIAFMEPLASATQSYSICCLLIVHTRLLRSFS